jgi:hypothetical protein
MNLPDELTHDIVLFLSKVDELKHSDRKELLVAMMRKHLVLSQSDIMLDKYDLDMIISGAKSEYSKEPIPTRISGREIDQNEAVKILLIESAVRVFNNKGALKRIPKFDRR